MESSILRRLSLSASQCDRALLLSQIISLLNWEDSIELSLGEIFHKTLILNNLIYGLLCVWIDLSGRNLPFLLVLSWWVLR